jgi:hypothetical protein
MGLDGNGEVLGKIADLQERFNEESSHDDESQGSKLDHLEDDI